MIAISGSYDNDFRNRRTDIYLMDNDGHQPRCLTDAQRLSSYNKLQWLAHESILFMSYTPTALYHMIDLATGVVRPFIPELNPQLITAVTADGSVFFPGPHSDLLAPMHSSLGDCSNIVVEGDLVDVSRNGQWIVFYKKESRRFVYLQKLNTAEVQKISMSYGEYDGDGRTVTWSPDARYLAYQAGYQDLWVMRADGTQRRHVAHLNYFWLNFRWSPDSTSIAFIGSVPAAQGGGPDVSEVPLYVTAIDDPAPRYLATLRKSDDSGGAWDWMPDSQHIVYATHEHDVASLYKINTQSGEQHLLTDSGQPFAAIYDVAVSW